MLWASVPPAICAVAPSLPRVDAGVPLPAESLPEPMAGPSRPNPTTSTADPASTAVAVPNQRRLTAMPPPDTESLRLGLTRYSSRIRGPVRCWRQKLLAGPRNLARPAIRVCGDGRIPRDVARKQDPAVVPGSFRKEAVHVTFINTREPTRQAAQATQPGRPSGDRGRRRHGGTVTRSGYGSCVQSP